MATKSGEYWSLPGFEDLYLEDSWVLGIVARPGILSIRCDLVLRESHPDHTPPKPGEQYCYRSGVVTFNRVETLKWDGQTGTAASVGSSGDDYGSFDRFEFATGVYEIAGDFGQIAVRSEPPSVELDTVGTSEP